jgi:hypothetical protein
VEGLGFRIEGLGSRLWAFVLRVHGIRLKVQDSGFRA